MSKNLVIVESPTKARTLQRFLGKEYLVEASIGHINNLQSGYKAEYTGPVVGLDQDFQPIWEYERGAKTRIDNLSKIAKSCENIYLAADPDREGEGIAFHVANALIEKGSQIVISSDRPPSGLDRIQDRIKSRLSGGLVIDIQPPDLELRIKILKSKFEEIKRNFSENYELNDEVLKFLASEITSSIREMVGALNRVLAFSKIKSKSPNIYECKTILKDFINSNKKSINIESIQNMVANHFNLNIKEMLSPRRSRSLARPRQIAMYLAKQHTVNSLPDIGRKFSNRDHTTVIHAVKKIEELMKKDNEIERSVLEIKKKLL